MHAAPGVVGVHVSFVETDMTEGIGAPKISPKSVARQVFDAVEADQVEVLADERIRSVKASLPRDHEVIYPPLQASWDAAMKARADAAEVLATGPPRRLRHMASDLWAADAVDHAIALAQAATSG